MAKTYTIKTPYITATRKRRDSAARLFSNLVYNALEADGQLDTKAGNAVWVACRNMANSVMSGAYTMFSFSQPLPHNAGLIQFECNE